MKRKGFTLVELLVVIAIIALLMGILMPALARVRQLAFRMTCGTNLSGIGKAMLIYANDYEDELPRAGGRNTQWGQTPNWMAPDRFTAFGLDRTAMVMVDAPSIRDVIAFPKTQRGFCPLTGAPGDVDHMQLTELNLRILDTPHSH